MLRRATRSLPRPLPPLLLLLLLVLLATPLPARSAAHPGSPIFFSLDLRKDEALFQLSAEQDLLLPHWLQLRTEDYGVEVGPARRAEVEQRFREFLNKHGTLEVRGQRLEPASVRVEFPSELHRLYQKPGMRFVIRYPLRGIPQSVTLRWECFAGLPTLYREPEVPMEVVCLGQYDAPILSKSEPEYTWHARQETTRPRPKILVPPPPPPPTIPLPLLSLGILLLGCGVAAWQRGHIRILALLLALGGAAASHSVLRVEVRHPFPPAVRVPEPEKAREIFQQLHALIYRAFEGSSENEIYDLLAASVSPNLIEELYGAIYESLVMRSEGGAVCTVTELEVVDGEVRSRDQDAKTFEVDWHWKVHGQVSHWGHRHTRINEYRALYEVAFERGSWKIAAVEMLEQRRIDK